MSVRFLVSGKGSFVRNPNIYKHDFLVTLSLVEYMTIEHSTFTKTTKQKITVKWYFSHTSKTIYRKLQYKQKFFEEFQGLFPLPRKMFLYSSTKFGILKPWTNIPWRKRFDLGFSQISKQIYRKLQYMEKSFEEFQGLPRFPRKMILCSSIKFGTLKSSTNISWPRKFDLGFWKTSKKIYRKLQHKEKDFEVFQDLSRFRRKIVLYSSIKLSIMKPWTNIQSLRRFDLILCQTSKQI